MARIAIKDNGSCPYVCLVGKNSSIWFAYPTFIKALIKFPRLAWSFRNHG